MTSLSCWTVLIHVMRGRPGGLLQDVSVSVQKCYWFVVYLQDCGLVLTSNSDSRGCYPLDDHILCKTCNARRIQILTGKVTTDL